MTKTLLTGGAGYIESVLIPFLLDKGYKTNVYDSLLYGEYSLLPFISNKNFSFIKGDVRDNLKSQIIPSSYRHIGQDFPHYQNIVDFFHMVL